MKTKIIFIHGDKGGVGKSTTAQSVADYLITQEEPVAIIDADTSNPDVARMFDGYVDTQNINLRNENGWMDAMDFIKAHMGQNIVINLPAGIGDEMEKNMEMFTMFIRDQEIPIEMQLWWVMNLSHDAVNLLDKAFKEYGRFFDCTRTVCNLHSSIGDRKQFFLWDESDLKKKMEINHNSMTIYLPALHLRVVQKLFAPSKTMPFHAAMDLSIGEDLAFLPSENWKLKYWHRDMQIAFAPAFGYKSPEPYAQHVA